MDGNGSAVTYGTFALLVLYYSASLQISYASSTKRDKFLYAVFFVLSMVTVLLELYWILEAPTDSITHTVLFYGVGGQVFDLLWGMWPRSGALVLLVSQVFFAVHVVPEAPGVFMIVVAAFTAIIIAVAQSRRSQYRPISM